MHFSNVLDVFIDISFFFAQMHEVRKYYHCIGLCLEFFYKNIFLETVPLIKPKFSFSKERFIVE